MNFVEKYKPIVTKELIGRENEISQVKSNLKKPILIHGPTGSGKTIIAHCLAKEMQYELIEVNASDFRNKDEINKIIGNSIKQQSLFKKSKIILVDELDGVSGKEDRGGVQALIELIKETTYPMIITANDPWNSKFSTLRQKCKLIEFKKLNTSDVYKHLKNICIKENIKHNDETLKELSRISNGDLRAAINDLEIVSYNKELKKEDISDLGERETESSIFNAIQLILKSTNPEQVLGALDYTNTNLDESLLWLEENIPTEYKNPADLERAFNILSKADIFRGRIIKWQYWRFLSYVNQLLTAGVAVSKRQKYYGFTKYKRPLRILNIWRSNIKNKERKEKATLLSKDIHLSIKRTIKEMPYMKFL